MSIRIDDIRDALGAEGIAGGVPAQSGEWLLAGLERIAKGRQLHDARVRPRVTH